MLENIKRLVGVASTCPVFIIGTGRSGTHWLGYSLENHSEIRATVETQPMFDLSVQMAMNPLLEEELFPKLVAAYRWQLMKSTTRVYLDKTHPNIWVAEKLKAAFPQSLFIGIERNPYATVASMLKHKEVSEWHQRWREFPIPNRFLGISEDCVEKYEDIPLPSQCAMRWLAHHNKMEALKGNLKDSLLVIEYESLAGQSEEIINNLQQFLDLKKPIPVPDVKKESLSKWKTQLSDEEVSQIQFVVKTPPDESTS